MVAGLLVLEDHTLALFVVLERPVPVEVIRLQVGQGRRVRRPARVHSRTHCLVQPVQHRAGELEHDPIVGFDLVEMLQERSTDVAAEVRAFAAACQDVVDHRRGSRFACGPRHADDTLARDPLDQQANLGRQRNPGGLGHSEKPVLPGPRHGRVDDHQVALPEVAFIVTAKVKRHAVGQVVDVQSFDRPRQT